MAHCRLESMEVLVSLQYPNGRIYETSYESSVELRPGSEFDLHGRHWLVVGSAKQQTPGSPQPSAADVVRVDWRPFVTDTIGLDFTGQVTRWWQGVVVPSSSLVLGVAICGESDTRTGTGLPA